jgi:hypothetical protein
VSGSLAPRARRAARRAARPSRAAHLQRAVVHFEVVLHALQLLHGLAACGQVHHDVGHPLGEPSRASAVFCGLAPVTRKWLLQHSTVTDLQRAARCPPPPETETRSAPK